MKSVKTETDRSVTKDNDEILFVFGPARGGTTFLADILDRYFGCSFGPEGTFIPSIVKKASLLGNIHNERNYNKLISALCHVEMLDIIRYKWPKDRAFNITESDILSRSTERTVASAIYATFKSVADYKGKHRVAVKNPGFWKYLPLLEDLYHERARYIFIIRDGRDVSLSLKNFPWGEKSTYEAAKNWKKMVMMTEEFKASVDKNRFLEIRYEDLLQHPEKTIEETARFLSESDVERIKDEYVYYAKNNIKSNNFNKWKEQMSQADIYTFESIAGDILSQYGYERWHNHPKISLFLKFQCEASRMNRLIKINSRYIYEKIKRTYY